MSRAFVKEDVDPPERSGRVRSASGLPPGATNYITAAGAVRLRKALEKSRRESKTEAVAELERTLASVSVVDPPSDLKSVGFGARVTVRDKVGKLQSYRIVGVDELAFHPDAVSWISPTGRTLLAADLGNRVALEDGETVELVQVEYPND